MIRFIVATRTAVITLAVVVGGPILLTTTLGSPIPHPWPTSQRVRLWFDEPFNPVYAADTARVFAWVLWLLVTAAVTAGLLAQLSRLRWPNLAGRLPGPAQSLTAALLGTAAITTVTGTAAPAAAAAAAHDATSPAPDTDAAIAKLAPADDTSAHATRTPATATHRSTPVTVEQRTSPEPSVAARGAAGSTHRVAKGDTLWAIADDQLHDPRRWPEIYRLNQGQPQPNGHVLQNPNQIDVGWVLTLPAAQSTAPSTSGSRDNPEPATPRTQPDPSTSTAPATASPPTSSTTRPVASAMPSQTTSVRTSRPAELLPARTRTPEQIDVRHGVTLPSRGWVSLGMAATIAALATLLRLQHRRRARLRFPIPVRTGRTPPPVPDSLRPADAAGTRVLAARADGPLSDLMPQAPRVPAPIGIDKHGTDISLFEVPGSAVALDGPGAPAAARAITAAVLATDVAEHLPTRPTLVVPADTLAGLLPDGKCPSGLDPHHETFDEERLIVVTDTAAAVTHLENEMIHRRRLLDDLGADTVGELNGRTDHVEHLAPYVLLTPADTRYTTRILAVAAHRHTLHLHPVILGALPDIPDVTRLDIAVGGTFTATPANKHTDPLQPCDGRLAVLAAHDLTDLLGMITAAAPRPETGQEPTRPAPQPATEPDQAAHDIGASHIDLTEIPRTGDPATPEPVQFSVLGPPTLATANGPIPTGIRRGSLAVLAVLAAHPRGRTFEELAADLHPDTDPETGINRVRTDLNAIRSLLREATGIQGRGKFIVYDSGSGRYRIDPELIQVDLWRMLAAIGSANQAGDDETACLAALNEAVACYGGDFAEGQDRAWIIDYATPYRHQLLGAYARIAEILETDHPDQAVAALEAAIEREPVNEELYQRVMRIHGRLGRPDAVRRTLRLLEDRLAELGEAEPSEATRRIAARQLKPTLTSHR